MVANRQNRSGIHILSVDEKVCGILKTNETDGKDIETDDDLAEIKTDRHILKLSMS